MKKITAGVVLMMCVAFGASAQDKHEGRHGKRHSTKHHHEYKTKDLNLTDQQKQQMKALKDNHRKEMTELNHNEGLTVKEMRERKGTLTKEYRSSVENILTPEQKKKIQLQRARSVEKRREMHAKRMETIKKDLSLSDDQTSNLKSLNESFTSKFESIRQNESLDQTARKEQIKVLKQQHKAELKNVLSLEQIQKLEEMRNDKGGRKQAK